MNKIKMNDKELIILIIKIFNNRNKTYFGILPARILLEPIPS